MAARRTRRTKRRPTRRKTGLVATCVAKVKRAARGISLMQAEKICGTMQQKKRRVKRARKAKTTRRRRSRR